MSGSVDVDAEVRKRFEVTNTFQLPDGNIEFSVAYNPQSKPKFEELSRVLAPSGFVPQLMGDAETCALIVKKEEGHPAKGSRFTIILALFTVLTIVAFSILWQLLYEYLVPGIPGYVIFLTFMLLTSAVIGAHELARRIVSLRSGAGALNQYLIPGIPVLGLFMPSVGFLSLQKSPAVNRDRLFDVIAAGPFAVFLASALFYALGDLTSFQSTVPLSASQAANSTVALNPNIIQLGLDGVLGGALPHVQVGHVLLSPLGEVGTIGFILAFVMLLPMTVYDGGNLTSLVIGPDRSRTSTFLCVLLLLLVDTPNYWALAVVVLVVAGRPAQLKLLDEVSPVSRSRRYLMVGSIVLAFLCMPLPGNLAGLALT